MSFGPFDPGSVRLRLRWKQGRIGEAAVAAVRPDVAAVLRGREADAAVRQLPLLYSICGAAQGLAARLALAAARGAAAAPAVDAAVLAEARREHLWRLLLDWPELLGQPRREALFVEGRRRLAEADFSAWAVPALRDSCGRIEAALRDLPDPPPAAAAAFLPPLAADQTVALWPRLDAAFAAAPAWQGQAAETGALVRHSELQGLPPVWAHFAARVADLAEPARLGCASAVPVAPGVGRAAVDTARGLLLHEIVLDGERVADYVVVAPTEWNFHPRGALRSWLEGAAAATLEEARSLARRAVLALDPCVASAIDADVPGSG